MRPAIAHPAHIAMQSQAANSDQIRCVHARGCSRGACGCVIGASHANPDRLLEVVTRPRCDRSDRARHALADDCTGRASPLRSALDRSRDRSRREADATRTRFNNGRAQRATTEASTPPTNTKTAQLYHSETQQRGHDRRSDHASHRRSGDCDASRRATRDGSLISARIPTMNGLAALISQPTASIPTRRS